MVRHKGQNWVGGELKDQPCHPTARARREKNKKWSATNPLVRKGPTLVKKKFLKPSVVVESHPPRKSS